MKPAEQVVEEAFAYEALAFESKAAREQRESMEWAAMVFEAGRRRRDE